MLLLKHIVSRSLADVTLKLSRISSSLLYPGHEHGQDGGRDVDRLPFGAVDLDDTAALVCRPRVAHRLAVEVPDRF